ncbi:hypothetical protein [Pseudobacteriovorax antillogorgiicola]|uniref:Uncharacterized protein n=1 Tax=Pseudobacteriovorax antillogorgiicola TaxID=1513793 RepID=A0A1Y6CVB3_9BACT|nr:hypothetical protein [Pseudobacteriovorax antillogorgiicola]TCS44805.1 hypothetical protein EDD56_13134 [Pseudobacteriovorax antillogorgiicola]SMF77325.1 hypothetical protein SAMN06296036_13130 [Pseudobacteriovorax antillogorgiicola]
MMRSIVLLILVSLPFASLSAQDGDGSPYAAVNRAEHIRQAIDHFTLYSKDDINKFREYVAFMKKTSCRSSDLELKVQCLSQGAKDYCQEFDERDRNGCHKVLDILVAGELGLRDFISAREQVKILQSPDSHKNSLQEELWNRYAELATSFRISPEITCLTRKEDCFAISIDSFCRKQADYGHSTWQACSSALIQFITADASMTQGLIKAKEKPQESEEEDKDEQKMPGVFVVSFESDLFQHGWIARAMERTTFHVLSGFERLEGRPAPAEFHETCYPLNCQLEWLGREGVHIFIKGKIVYDDLILQIYDIQNEELISDSIYKIKAGSDLNHFKIEMFKKIRAFSRHGGILDSIEARQDLEALTSEDLVSKEKFFEILGIDDPYSVPAVLLEIGLKIYPIVGGLLWGLMLVFLSKVIFPRIYGFDSFANRVQPSLLKSWALISSWRLVIMTIVLAPSIGILWWLKQSSLLPDLLYWTLAVPVIGLLSLFVLALISESLTLIKDRKRIIGKARSDNEHHKALQRYFEEYLARNDLTMEPRLIKNTLFLAQKAEGVISYGGALGKARIVIDQELIDLAIGNLEDQPEDDTAPIEEIPVTFEPDEDSEELDSEDEDEDEELKIRQDKKLKSKFMKFEQFKNLTSFKDFEVEALGEKGLSVDEPEPELPEQAVDQEEDEDPDFVRKVETRTEHYQDFMYGLLLSELGAVYARHSLFKSFSNSLSEVRWRLPGGFRSFGEYLTRTYKRNYSRYPHLIKDSLVAAYRGIPHMLQYLYLRQNDDKSVLTNNADGQQLWIRSHEILDIILAEDKESEEDSYFNNATFKNRIVWLNHHISSKQRVKRRTSVIVRLARLALILALIGAAGYKVYESVHYNDIYTFRIDEQKRKIAEAKEEREKNKIPPLLPSDPKEP